MLSPVALTATHILLLVVLLLSAICGSSCSGCSTNSSSCSSWSPPQPPRILLLMIMRNEEHNLRSNLRLWLPFIDYYVVGVDDRTDDRSVHVVNDVLGPGIPPDRRATFFFSFDGLGPSRTIALQEAWRRFPQATHVLMADPDWQPVADTIAGQLSQLDDAHSVFAMKIFDRNGRTTRWIDWIFLHRENLRFRYRWHEALVLPDGVEYVGKRLTWEVREVDTNTSWHANQHGGSASYERYVFEISLLELDEIDYPGDARVQYYLGIDHLIAGQHASALVASNSEHSRSHLADVSRTHYEVAMKYLRTRTERFAAEYGSDESGNPEMTWAAYFWLGYAQHRLLGLPQQAKDSYAKCIDFDPERADCMGYLSLLLMEEGELLSSWRQIERAFEVPIPVRSFMNNFYVYDCLVPMQLARVVGMMLLVHDKVPGVQLSVAREAWEKARKSCTKGVYEAPPNVLESLQGTLGITTEEGGKRRGPSVDGLQQQEAPFTLDFKGKGDSAKGILLERLQWLDAALDSTKSALDEIVAKQ